MTTVRDYPVTARPTDLTRRMQRDHEKLPPSQIIREILTVNPSEHRIIGADNVAVADVEKIAAVHLRDEDGKPVFRRIWSDNCSGIPRDDMPRLLLNYGESSKPSAVFSGNHGEGAILSGAPENPNGLVFISKDAEHETPYVCVFNIETDEDGNVEAGLMSFDDGAGRAPAIADADLVPYEEVDGTVYTMLDVWNRAYANPRFGGVPEHGTVVLELGKHFMDSTYMRTQRTFDSGRGKNEWAYSRWAVGEYLNSRFRRFPEDIKFFWGVPGDDFAFNLGEARNGNEAYAFKQDRSEVSFDGSRNWGYREAVGLDQTIFSTGSSDEDAGSYEGAEFITDSEEYPDGPVPFTAEVIIRELPDPKKARKLAFSARRFGQVYIDYNDEVFPRTEGSPHDMFGVTHADAKYSVWIAIKPYKVGVQEAGAVWMPSGRTDLMYVGADGNSHYLPWPQLAKQFRERMPAKLVEWIQAKDATEPDEEITDPEVQKFFDRFMDETKPLPPKPKKIKGGTAKPETGFGNSTGEETRNPGRGPIEHPGQVHAEGDGTTTRRSPSKRVALIKKSPDGGVHGVVEDSEPTPPKTPQPPLHKWVEDAEEWPEDHSRWAVLWEPPSEANQDRGRVKLNWNHWYVQEVYTKNVDRTSKPVSSKKLIKNVFLKSVLSKIAHRRQEANKLKLTDTERETLFSPMALSGFVMGWYDHEQRLNAGSKNIAAAEYDETEEEGSAA